MCKNKLKIYRITTLILMLSLGALRSNASPPPFSGCTTVEHCSIGYYCETAVRLCRKCIGCEDLGRKAPEEACVKSVAECGGCLEGLVVDTSSEHCTSPDELQLQLPPYWVAAVAGLLIFGLVVLAFAVYAFRRKEIFKSACTTTPSVRERASPSVEASAPLPPPPYNEAVALPSYHSEESFPFIKPIHTPSSPRYQDESQSAVVSENPTYPPSEEEVPMMAEPLPTIQEVSVDNTSDLSRSTQSELAEEVVTTPLYEGTATPGGDEQRSSGNTNDAPPDPEDAHEDTSHAHGGGSADGIGNSAGGGPAVFVTIVNHNALRQGNYLS